VNIVREKLCSQFICGFIRFEKNDSYDCMHNETVSLAQKVELLDDAANGEGLLNAQGVKEATTTLLMEYEAAGKATS
jgi:hypothetical protein